MDQSSLKQWQFSLLLSFDIKEIFEASLIKTLEKIHNIYSLKNSICVFHIHEQMYPLHYSDLLCWYASVFLV